MAAEADAQRRRARELVARVAAGDRDAVARAVAALAARADLVEDVSEE